MTSPAFLVREECLRNVDLCCASEDRSQLVHESQGRRERAYPRLAIPLSPLLKLSSSCRVSALGVSPAEHSLGHEHDWSQYVGLGYAFSNGFRLEREIGQLSRNGVQVRGVTPVG